MESEARVPEARSSRRGRGMEVEKLRWRVW